ncbi:hypothetical protein J6TS7_46860 [Paenibacillus dendritiformis]|nr:hypothetical protein J6TS7_46860 [Paenibacillus dendritiformis]
MFNRSDSDYGWATAHGFPYGWVSYEFEEPVVVNKYTLQARGNHIDYKTESPKYWTFEGWDGSERRKRRNNWLGSWLVEKKNLLFLMKQNTKVTILVVTMTTGLEKEFDLSMDEVNAFINWYENKQAGTGTASYAIDKHNNNKGPFSSRKDYVIYDKILTFEVNEYSIK